MEAGAGIRSAAPHPDDPHQLHHLAEHVGNAAKEVDRRLPLLLELDGNLQNLEPAAPPIILARTRSSTAALAQASAGFGPEYST